VAFAPKILAAALLLVALTGAPTAACAQTAGDREAGHRLAQRWCAQCHVVDASGQGSDAAPAFSEIAQKHGKDEHWLRAWLTAPHPPMPNLNLSRVQIDNVIAYLQGLEPR